jgi:hypothetical protein
MTTFTTQDLEALEKGLEFFKQLKGGDVSIEVEPIPFMGMVQLQDKEDTEQMLRDQLTIVQAECQRLKKKLMENGIHD